MGRFVRGRIAFGFAVVASLVGAQPSPAKAEPRSSRDGHWVATWAAASKAPTIFDRPLPVLSDVTLRQIVRISAGGAQIRVWLTNEAGSAPLRVDAATVALRGDDSALASGTLRTLTFDGAPAISIAPGARVVSDPVRLRAPDLADLAISIHLPDDVSAAGSPITYHVRALQTSYLASGNQTAANDLSGGQPEVSWFFLAGVDVVTAAPIPVLGAFGDSITDGDQLGFPNEPVDQNARYTNFLAERLLDRRKPGARAAVVNLGISGNQVTATFIGDNAQARLGRDALAQTGITHLIVIEGINDIGLPGLLTAIGLPTPSIAADEIIAGHQQIVARARARGLIVVGGTLSPAGGSALPGYFGAVAEAKRQAVNAWIRTSGAYDLVVDFDALLRDPSNPAVMQAALTADGLHPNSEGYRRMADAVFGALLDGRRPRGIRD